MSLCILAMSAFCADQPHYWAENEYQGLEASFNDLIKEISKSPALDKNTKLRYAKTIETMLSADEGEKSLLIAIKDRREKI